MKDICGQIKLPFQGDIYSCVSSPGRCPWVKISWAFSPELLIIALQMLKVNASSFVTMTRQGAGDGIH